EAFVGGPNVKVLCDGSTTIDGWVASGKGKPFPQFNCLNGRPPDAVAYVANAGECPPNVPPCPNSLKWVAQEGARFVDLTGNAARPPAAYGSVSQDVQTEAGQRYELSFFIGSSPNPASADNQQHGAVLVEFDGVVITPPLSGIGDNLFHAPSPQRESNWSDPN